MRKLVFLLIVAFPISCLSQSDTLLVDFRDNKSYPIVEIGGILWMSENLDYATELSVALNTNQQALSPEIKGRWYHLDELETVCPNGWQLPNVEDWLNYFEYISAEKETTFKVRSGKENISIDKFEDKIDLFEKNNPLNISPTGIFQGSNFLKSSDFLKKDNSKWEKQADYWIADLPTVKNTKKSDLSGKTTYKPVRVVYEGKSHIHLYNEYTNIHSHEHHLIPSEKETLRRFMVRCVCYDIRAKDGAK